VSVNDSQQWLCCLFTAGDDGEALTLSCVDEVLIEECVEEIQINFKERTTQLASTTLEPVTPASIRLQDRLFSLFHAYLLYYMDFTLFLLFLGLSTVTIMSLVSGTLRELSYRGLHTSF
jgi:hypothetical protein